MNTTSKSKVFLNCETPNTRECGYIYILAHKKGSTVKVGETRVSPTAREKDYVKTYKLKGFHLMQTFKVPSSERKSIEKAVHKTLEEYQLSGLAGAREIFSCSEPIAAQAISDAISQNEKVKLQLQEQQDEKRRRQRVLKLQVQIKEKEQRKKDLKERLQIQQRKNEQLKKDIADKKRSAALAKEKYRQRLLNEAWTRSREYQVFQSNIKEASKKYFNEPEQASSSEISIHYLKLTIFGTLSCLMGLAFLIFGEVAFLVLACAAGYIFYSLDKDQTQPKSIDVVNHNKAYRKLLDERTQAKNRFISKAKVNFANSEIGYVTLPQTTQKPIVKSLSEVQPTNNFIVDMLSSTRQLRSKSIPRFS